MAIFDIFRRKKKDDEATRRAQLIRAGRIADGSIFDIVTDESGAITQIFFNYTINGVDYEASPMLDPEQRELPLRHTVAELSSEKVIPVVQPKALVLPRRHGGSDCIAKPVVDQLVGVEEENPLR